MKKLKCLFEREDDEGKFNRLVIDKVVPEAQWVADGEGVATRKYDGTCVRISPSGVYYKRYDAKHGKVPPEDFLPAQSPDKITGHWPGWVPIKADKPEDKWFLDALIRQDIDPMVPREILKYYPPGTYELCGPKINGNPDKFASHMLVRHGDTRYPNFPRDFQGIKEKLAQLDIEGVVFHRNPGSLVANDMVKIRLTDFGLKKGGER